MVYTFNSLLNLLWRIHWQVWMERKHLRSDAGGKETPGMWPLWLEIVLWLAEMGVGCNKRSVTDWSLLFRPRIKDLYGLFTIEMYMNECCNGVPLQGLPLWERTWSERKCSEKYIQNWRSIKKKKKKITIIYKAEHQMAKVMWGNGQASGWSGQDCEVPWVPGCRGTLEGDGQLSGTSVVVLSLVSCVCDFMRRSSHTPTPWRPGGSVWNWILLQEGRLEMICGDPVVLTLGSPFKDGDVRVIRMVLSSKW